MKCSSIISNFKYTSTYSTLKFLCSRRFSTNLDKYRDIEKTAQVIFNKHIGEIVSITKLGNHRNFIYKVTDFNNDYVIKIFNNEARPFPNTEPFVNNKLQGLTRINKCIVSKKYISDSNEEFDFMIFNYVKGNTILQEITNNNFDNSRLENIIKQIYDFTNTCTNIKLSNFGSLNQLGIGKSESWIYFLSNYLEFIYKDIEDLTTNKNSFLYKQHQDLAYFLQKESSYFKSIEQGFLVPYDLNLNNFILTEDDKVVAIDTESFVSGDKLLPLGIWLSNTYGTELYNCFFQNYALNTNFENKVISFYSNLKALSILIYVYTYKKENAILEKPYGNNTHTFLSIIETCTYKMKEENNNEVISINGYNYIQSSSEVSEIEVLGQDGIIDPID